MTDPNVQRVREWLQHRLFSLRILTLMVFMEDEFGGEVRKGFDRYLKEVHRKLPQPEGKPN